MYQVHTFVTHDPTASSTTTTVLCYFPSCVVAVCGRAGVGTQHEARPYEVRPSAPASRRRRAADRAQDDYPAGARVNERCLVVAF